MMSEAYGDHSSTGLSRSSRLDRILGELVGQVPEIEAASVVSFDGLAMASALPVGMDEDRVAAMSAALLSLGERAAEGLGRGALSQVYIEGENGTVFLISADDEAVLVAVAAKGAKVGLMLFEVRRAAAVVAETLRVELAYETVEETPHPAPLQVVAPPADESDQPADDQPAYDHQHAYDQPAYYAQPLTDELVSDNHTGESAETPSWS
jgi:predicted regulator of Ras-like GTPase activity (Roadblock/LC7/MglB family)